MDVDTDNRCQGPHAGVETFLVKDVLIRCDTQSLLV